MLIPAVTQPIILPPLQEVYDLVKGQVAGDELYVEGLDDAFLDWRAQHGEEWARYYGLRVRAPPLIRRAPSMLLCMLSTGRHHVPTA